MHDKIDRVLITEAEIEKRIAEIGTAITADYQGKDLIVVCVLKGAFMFLSSLVKKIDLPVSIDFIAVSSYGSSTKSSGVVRFLKDLNESIEGRHVLIVEDIVDTGLTLHYLADNLLSRRPASVKICTLLSKPSRRQVEVEVDYIGFDVPDYFVVGYGLDYSEIYRNLPDICVLKNDAC
jgi:hypoxanthine phosphoribosyltransferase